MFTKYKTAIGILNAIYVTGCIQAEFISSPLYKESFLCKILS